MTSNLWAKLWVEILGDPKLMRAARKGAPGIELLPWFIAWAKRADDDGRLTVAGEPAELADYVDAIPNVTQKRVKEALASLIRIGVLVNDSGALRLTNWTRRQAVKPSDAPERVRERVNRHRERQAATPVITPAVTPECNAPEAPDVTPQSKSKKETKEKEPDQEPDGGGPKSADIAADYSLKITVAANTGITAKWGEQTHPLVRSASYGLTQELTDQGIDVDRACASIREQCERSSKPSPPKSINWFRDGILQSIAESEERAVIASMPPEPDAYERAAEIVRQRDRERISA